MIPFIIMHNEWLIVPMGVTALFVAALVLKSEQNRRTTALIKTYTDQGKPVPPQLLKLLRH